MINYNTRIASYFNIFFWTKAGLYLIDFGKKREGIYINTFAKAVQMC